MTIKRKIEKALAEVLRTNDGFQQAGVTVIEGRADDERTLPCVIVYAESAAPPDDFPSGSGIWAVSLKVFVLTQADDERVEDQDQRTDEVIRELLGNPDTLAAVNAPGEEPDERLVKDLHVYDIQEEALDEGRDERHFGDVLNFTVICQGVDG